MATRKSTRGRKKPERIARFDDLSDLPDLQDELDSAIAVVQTVSDAISGGECEEYVALVLSQHALEPLFKVKEMLYGLNDKDAP